ncbi:hypothetical protein [Jannaschia sp. R86511]
MTRETGDRETGDRGTGGGAHVAVPAEVDLREPSPDRTDDARR